MAADAVLLERRHCRGWRYRRAKRVALVISVREKGYRNGVREACKRHVDGLDMSIVCAMVIVAHKSGWSCGIEGMKYGANQIEAQPCGKPYKLIRKYNCTTFLKRLF